MSANRLGERPVSRFDFRGQRSFGEKLVSENPIRSGQALHRGFDGIHPLEFARLRLAHLKEGYARRTTWTFHDLREFTTTDRVGDLSGRDYLAARVPLIPWA